MILLSDVLAPWFHYAGPQYIEQLTLDSRQVKAGYLFVAVPGHNVDGRDYIAAALERGAVAALVHTDEPEMHGQVDQQAGLIVYFFQLNRQLSAVAAQCYPLIPSAMKLIGITGTNGKTSVSQLIAQLVTLIGQRAAVMGTLGNGIWGDLTDTGNTTADAITLMRQLSQFQHHQADLCALEVSSHGLVQGRVDAVPIDIAVFTNLSRDHLDYHDNMDAYGAAKKRLFHMRSLDHGLLNVDDPVGQRWLTALSSQPNNNTQFIGFSINPGKPATYRAEQIQYHNSGVTAELVWPQGIGTIRSPLLGEFNLSNLVAALSALHLSGIDLEVLLSVVPRLHSVPGRMETFISTPSQISLVVDYAHTPDALAQALQALQRHCKGQLWCVFGCGGDRDKGKRPLMAAAAEQYADRVVVTSDNPRTESATQIIAEVVAGLSKPEQATIEVDRIQAIRRTVALAQAGDMILLAGKGHETYQDIGTERVQYDERALAQQLAGSDHD